jgi:glycine/D-amino acid oxidase-like deaminating enzyme
VDDGAENASKVAAGLLNPITGLRLVKTAAIEQFLSAAIGYYQRLSQLFGQVFYVAKPMWRILQSPQEYQYALKRCHDTDYQPYLGAWLNQGQLDSYGITLPFGGVEQYQTGYVLTRPLLHCLQHYLTQRYSYYRAIIDYDTIQLTPTPSWQHIRASKIIFCEGYRAMQNPWFAWLPFQPAKGEILTLQHHTTLPDTILNHGHWLIPLTNTTARIGATFDTTQLNPTPTVAGQQQLLAGLKGIIPGLTPAVIDHTAQVRPNTLDKQPFIGMHPRHSQLAIFNGFGAKGSLTIPLYSQLFANSLLQQSPVLCSIARHYDNYFPG